MPLTRIPFKRWMFLVDVEATAAAYARLAQGGPEQCGCLHCRNFVAARDKAYPTEAVDFLTSIGIYPIREAEIYHCDQLRPGVHLYGGWLHAVGSIQSGPDSYAVMAGDSPRVMSWEPLTPQFSMSFTSTVDQVPETFPKSGLFQVDFTAEVPWVLDEPFAG